MQLRLEAITILSLKLFRCVQTESKTDFGFQAVSLWLCRLHHVFDGPLSHQPKQNVATN